MPELEGKIAAWRQQMAAGGIKTPAVLDELESHLREDVKNLAHTGILNESEAFKAAADRLGQSELLRAEFAKINVSQEARWVKPIGMGCGAFAVLFTLCCAPSMLFNGQLSSLELELGWMAVALTLFSVLSWRFSYKYLPVIRSPRARMRIAIACGFMSAACFYVFGLVLTNVMVPQMFHPENPVPEAAFRAGKIVGFRSTVPDEFSSFFWIGVAVLWAVAVGAVPGAIAYGLEEAARRRMKENAYV